METSKFEFSNRWIAFFDILGFKKLVSNSKTPLDLYRILYNYTDTLSYLREECGGYKEGSLFNTWFSDSFLLYTIDDSPSSYGVIEQASKHFFCKNISIRIPMRGAIAFGLFHTDETMRTYIGQALIDAYLYCEDQDWIGLILTPTATHQVRSYGLEPLHHDFTDQEVPMRNCPTTDVLAYTLSSGMANYESPLLTVLNEMMHFAPDSIKPKYERTIQHLKRHYRFIKDHLKT